jgi:hypothetical protein
MMDASAVDDDDGGDDDGDDDDDCVVAEIRCTMLEFSNNFDTILECNRVSDKRVCSCFVSSVTVTDTVLACNFDSLVSYDRLIINHHLRRHQNQSHLENRPRHHPTSRPDRGVLSQGSIS